MPRDNSGIYSLPNAPFVPDTTIDSAVMNGQLGDIVDDANGARPITAGGTGATNAAHALEALGAVPLAGGTLTGDLSLGGHALVGITMLNGGPLNTSNAILNGGFEVAQRGTSFASPASGAYTADRWPVLFDGTGATRTISQQLHALGQTAVPGEPKNFLRWAQTVAGSGATYNEYLYHIEGVRQFAGKTVTLTFYAALSTGPANVTANLAQVFGTGGSPSTAVNVGSQSVSIGTAFTKWQATFAIPSIAGKTLGTNGDDFIQLAIQLPVNATFTFDLSRVSLREGDVTAEADPFIPRSVGEELAVCQRYFVSFGGAANYEPYAVGEVGQTTHAYCYAKLPVRMRAAPTVASSGAMALLASGVTPFSVSALSLNAAAPDVVLLDCTSSGLTVGASAVLASNNNTTSRITFSAEL